MFASDSSSFPLVGLKPVSSAQNHWVALAFQLPAEVAPELLPALFGSDEAGALASLDIILTLQDPMRLAPAHVQALPASRLVLSIPAAACADEVVQQHTKALADAGCRLLTSGEAGAHGAKAGARGLDIDCSDSMPSALALLSLPGPHLARNVSSEMQREACRKAGFSLFSGDYAQQPAPQAKEGDGTTRKRLLALLALLSRDADSRELETLLKQDPSLSYHLLKLVNSAAFAPSSPIHNFGQAINVLGRRQLQRWLQLLLYARQQMDGPANALLPLAALRAAQMEALCKHTGGDRDAQDMAFLVGVFSLLDILLGMPMTEIVSAVNLDLDIVRALLDRAGPLGDMLKLVEQHQPDASAVRDVGIDNETYWRILLQAYHWALQVSRNV